MTVAKPVAEPAHVYLFYGADGFSAREELRALMERLDTEGNLSHNTVRFDATREPVKIEEVIAACQTASFFAEQRLVIVEGLLERLGGGRRSSGRNRRATAAGQSGDGDRLIDTLTMLPATTTAVLLESNPSKAFLEALTGIATVRQFPILRADGVRAWAQRRAESLGAKLTAPAAARLAELIDGSHLGDLAQEIDKLAAYAAGRPIEVGDIDAVVSVALQFQTWDLTDAVAAGRADRALRVLQLMDEKQHPSQLLFSMVVRQYRQLMLVKAAKEEGLSDVEVGRRLGIAHPFPLSKLTEQAARYQPARLDQAYRRLLETDVAVKTGVMEIEPALEMLIAELATMVGTSRSPAAARSR
jgi:DNA polymerase III subunit delta